VLTYWLSFSLLHGLIGNPAFLLGLFICIGAAAWQGLRGALVMVAVVAVIDRGFALSLTGPESGPETGLVAGVIALLVKLLLAGGLGLVVDSRRRVRSLNTQLCREIEGRTKSEESLRRSEQLYRALVESLGEGVGLFDADDRLVFANQALSSTLQVSRDALLGKRCFELMVKGSDEPIHREASAKQAVRSYEVVLQNDASTLLLVTETELDSSGARDARTLRVFRDLTERIVSERRQRELERELQRGQALQSLAVMAGGVAHDFNNLLCGVVGNAEVAARKVPAGAPPILSHCLAEIIAFANEAAQLSKQMLAYAGQRSLGIEALDSNSELSAALRLLHSTVESKARLVLHLAKGLPQVAADPFQLRQVVTNLVLNALDAMAGKRGVLTLHTEAVRLDAERAEQYSLKVGDYVKITVEDTGSGIPVEARERLFEPFFSTKAAGRGMGLAAAAGIVRAHRGWLGIDGTSEHGTRFSILLPVAAESTPRRTSVTTAPSLASAARNILLIDDERAVRVVTGRMLNELGHRVMTADSGQSGLELFRKQPKAIDLVVLDLTMPERSGEEILDELRILRDDVPVVITSGFQATDATELLRVPNVIAFLDKPHTLANLELVLASANARVGASVVGVAS
jgi:PAS domain S-box-containing protein